MAIILFILSIMMAFIMGYFICAFLRSVSIEDIRQEERSGIYYHLTKFLFSNGQGVTFIEKAKQYIDENYPIY